MHRLGSTIQGMWGDSVQDPAVGLEIREGNDMVFLYLNSNKMGDGDPDLGQELLQSYLRELAKAELKIDAVGCVNSAVYLTTEEGGALESLRVLEKNGTRIVSCGTCLDHYDRRSQLLIGGIGSMDQTVQIMAGAEKVIKPC